MVHLEPRFESVQGGPEALAVVDVALPDLGDEGRRRTQPVQLCGDGGPVDFALADLDAYETQITISWADQRCNGQPSIRFLIGTTNNGAGAAYTASGSSSISGPTKKQLTVNYPATAFTTSGGSVTIKADKKAFTTATVTVLCV